MNVLQAFMYIKWTICEQLAWMNTIGGKKRSMAKLASDTTDNSTMIANTEPYCWTQGGTTKNTWTNMANIEQ